MSSKLPINLGNLLAHRHVESSRIEYKASWDSHTADQVLRTICAFANDIDDNNGGYIVIGVEEESGVVKLPPRGLESNILDKIQREIRGHCNRIDPVFQPVLFPEVFEGKNLLVIWAPGSQNRPHQAPKRLEEKKQEKVFWVRHGSETVVPKKPILDELMQKAGRVPFDDQSARHIAVEKISESRVREYLHDVQSALIEEKDARVIYRSMKLVDPVNDHEAPRNVALLFFADDPEEVGFRGAHIEVAQFAGDAGGDVIEENLFRGPLHVQLRACINYLANLSTQHFEKHADYAEVSRWVSFPFAAFEEALANAIYHRDYRNPEPTKVFLYPDRMEIISYPGPVPGLETAQLNSGEPARPVPARNRRIGEFLKELRLAEGRYTGIPKLFRAMQQNGSPVPKIDFDPDRTYFRVTLPAHPEYIAIAALRDAATLQALGKEREGILRLETALKAYPAASALAAALIESYGKSKDLASARQIYKNFPEEHPNKPIIAAAFSNHLLLEGRREEAREVLSQRFPMLSARGAFELAIQERRLGRDERAIRYFERAGEFVLNDSKALHEYAQAKMKLAGKSRYKQPFANQQLLRDAQAMLKRVIQMDTTPYRRAWAWYDLGRVLDWLSRPKSEVEHALIQATSLIPEEPRFLDKLKRVQEQK